MQSDSNLSFSSNLVEITPDVLPKRENKPRAFFQSPYMNKFGSSDVVDANKRKVIFNVNLVPKKKVKGLYPFPNDFLEEPDFNEMCAYDSWFEQGLKINNK